MCLLLSPPRGAKEDWEEGKEGKGREGVVSVLLENNKAANRP